MTSQVITVAQSLRYCDKPSHYCGSKSSLLCRTKSLLWLKVIATVTSQVITVAKEHRYCDEPFKSLLWLKVLATVTSQAITAAENPRYCDEPSHYCGSKSPMLSRAKSLLWLKVPDAVASQVITVAQSPKCCDDLSRDESPRDCDYVFSQVVTPDAHCFHAVTVAIIPSGDFTIR